MRLTIAILSSLSASVLASILAYPRLPERVPIHWNYRGVADGYGSRLFACAFGPAMIAGLGLLLLVLNFVAPRLHRDRSQEPDGGSNEAMMGIPLFFIAFVHLVILLNGTGKIHDTLRLMAVAVAALTLLMGNIMGKVRPSFFVGIRVAPTLESPAIWRSTHRLAGRLMVLGGLASLVIALLVTGPAALWLAVGLMLLSLLVPVVYAYRLRG